MIYMTSDNRNLVADKDHFTQSFWGQILTPSSFANNPKTPVWCGDNEAFTGKYRAHRFYRWLWGKRPHRARCKFIAAPDVVGRCWPTLLRYLLHWPLIKALGFPVALVAQDGLERLPWALRRLPYDALFIGGSTEWKLSTQADFCIREAQRRGVWVHVGRVNSQKRMRHFKLIGVDSVDGTSLTYAPDRDFWRFQRVLLQPTLFNMEE